MPILAITSQHSEPESGTRAPDFKKSLRRLDRRVSWQWWNAVLVITLLMGTIVVLSLPRDFQRDDPLFQLQLTNAVRGLLGLVLIFNVYALYQQHLLKQLRNDLAGQVEIATEQRIRAEALYELSILDPLTGLFNRRHSDERLRSEMSRADRHGHALIVLAFDLDNFKQINDRFGHVIGDSALMEFARRLTKATRGSDFAARTGGDEFLVVLPECPPEKVKLVLSRMAPFDVEVDGNKFYVSGSCGWAQYQKGETAEQLIARADTALYAHKGGLTLSSPESRREVRSD
jgi:diguanylate cyclase (GGDEF)-like protein